MKTPEGQRARCEDVIRAPGIEPVPEAESEEKLRAPAAGVPHKPR